MVSRSGGAICEFGEVIESVNRRGGAGGGAFRLSVGCEMWQWRWNVEVDVRRGGET
jgi:hypothetical protein